jgi:hypothetical protein
MTPLVARLEPEERGVLLAALLGAGAAPLAALAEPARARCEAAWGDLQRAGRTERATVTALLLGQTAQPLPAALETLHPSWLAALVADEPPALVRALLEGLPPALQAAADLPPSDGTTALDVAAALPPGLRPALQRLLFAPALELLEDISGPIARALCALDTDELLGELERRGAAALGASLAGAPPEAQARALAGLGSRLAPVARAAMSAPKASAACAEARRDVAAANRAPAADAAFRLRSVGVRALARALAAEGEAELRRVAGRLPQELGRRLLAAGGAGGPRRAVDDARGAHGRGGSAMNEETRWDAS